MSARGAQSGGVAIYGVLPVTRKIDDPKRKKRKAPKRAGARARSSHSKKPPGICDRICKGLS